MKKTLFIGLTLSLQGCLPFGSPSDLKFNSIGTLDVNNSEPVKPTPTPVVQVVPTANPTPIQTPVPTVDVSTTPTPTVSPTAEPIIITFEELTDKVLLPYGCIRCHDWAESEEQLKSVLVIGSPEESLLFTEIESGNMPPRRGPVPEELVELVKDYILGIK